MVVPIEGPEDARVADYQAVSDRDLLRRQGLFVVEGRLPVRRLIEGGRFRLRSLLLSGPAKAALGAVLDDVPAHTPIYVCPVSTFCRLTGYHLHRGCLALAERRPAEPFERLIPDARSVVVLEAVADADNVGGVFRNAAAFGVDVVLLSPTCCDPLYRKAVRTSMAAALRVPFSRVEPWPSALSVLRTFGFTIVALSPRQPSTSLEEFVATRRQERLALVVGNEGEGLSTAVEALVDTQVRVRIQDEVDSLNVSVATGIALWALVGLTGGSEL